MAFRNTLYLLLISIFCFSLTLGHFDEDGYSCSHDQVEQDAQLLDVEEDTSSLQENGADRLLASSSYPNLRIYPYYGYLGSSAFELYMKNELIPPIVTYFQSALRVKYPVSGNLKLASSVTKICDRAPPSILKSSGVAADLFLYYDTYTNQNFVAYSANCWIASGTKRPLIGKVMMNSNRMVNPKGDPVKHERNLYTILHETMHILGFDSYQFNNFVDNNGNRLTNHVKTISIGGKSRTVVDLAPLTQRLRNHYGCSTLPGAIMENDGGSGTARSHFETKYHLWDIMCSYDSFGRRVSEFSLAFLEGTGWYAPDYTYAEPYFFGQGQGCSFINGACSSSGTPKFDEYCTGSSRGCGPQGRGGGYCSGNPLFENCRAVQPYDNFDCDSSYGEDYARFPDLEVYGRGAGSKCFEGTLNTRSSTSQTSFCFKYNCVGSGSSTQLEVLIGKNTYTCHQEGPMTINGYYGSIQCPDPLTFCNTVGKKYCPLNCAGKGKCVNGKCQCNSGSKGLDCTMKS